ncbi:MAG: collagen-like protein [Anaerolineae bacterium]|nr:collagen-like protein [Anaerolineae bacterium]
MIPGPQGSPGETGPAGSQGPQGPAGPQGPGGTGPAGPQGQPGPIGATGPQGPQGPAGAVGPTGAPGMSCWDTNGNGGADYYEDTNGDGVVNALDCQGPMGLTGPQGMVGPTGPAGAPGVSCWDVNGNSVAEASEDTNGDYYVNALDCQGPTGAQGNTGAQGPQGPRGLQGPVGAPGMSAATAVEVFRLGEVSISQTGFSVPLSGWYFTRSTKNIDFMLQIQSNLATDCWLAKVDLRLMRDGLAVQTIDGITLNILRNQEYVILFDGGNLLAATHSFDVEVRFERLSGRTDCTVTVDGLVSLAQFQGY